MDHEVCPGCGADIPRVEGPVHRYMESSPSCWAAYGELLAREYCDPAYLAVHQLTVDTYAVQHPGHPSPQSIQSVAVHLISLYFVLELGLPHQKATAIIKHCADSMRFTWLEPPASRGGITAFDVLQASTAKAHCDLVQRWAGEAWNAWSPHRGKIELWAAQAHTT